MRQYFVLADQGGGGDLRHHKSGVETGTRREEWRQPFVEGRIDQALDAALGDSGESAESDGEEVEGEGDGLAVEVASGEDGGFWRVLTCTGEGARASMARGKKYQRVIHRGVCFDFEDLTTMGESIANRAVHLRNTAHRIRVLHASTLAMRFANLAALEHAAEVSGGFNLSCMRTGTVNTFVEGHIGAT